MATRREMVLGLSALPLFGLGGVDAHDARLVSLAAEYNRFDREIGALEVAADKRWEVDRKLSRDESPAYLAMREELEALYKDKARIANAIINQPAESWLGVSQKLILWRREAAIVHRYEFDSPHETFTFSAYCDVLRLTGLQSFAHRYDATTARNMRDYW